MALVVVGKEGVLRRRCPSCAEDPHDIVLPLRPDDEHEASGDQPDRDEAVFGGGVGLVEQLQVVFARVEQRLGLLERDAVLLHVGVVLCGVSGERHLNSLPAFGTTSMAESEEHPTRVVRFFTLGARGTSGTIEPRRRAAAVTSATGPLHGEETRA